VFDAKRGVSAGCLIAAVAARAARMAEQVGDDGCGREPQAPLLNSAAAGVARRRPARSSRDFHQWTMTLRTRRRVDP